MNLSSENESSFEGYDKAARIIQKAWKNYLDICVFSHFRNLIYIRRQGDPHQLLKYIDPKEAELIDAASGINIRFRLGGEKFPPCIYYKIFTHRNIVDLCANSPRDYVNVIPKRLAHLPFFKNLKDDHRGWYQRVENNGWRLVSKRFWRASDEITEEGNRQKVNFPFSKMMRKQDFEKRRKYKKIQWMREMYYAGNLETKRADNRCTDLILKATKGLMRAVEQGGMKSVMEWEVDEILSWTNALNYEEYVNNWKSIATSNSSANLQGFRFETIWNQAANKNYSPSTIEAKEKQEKLKKLIEES
ncbi:protein MFI [Monodelphis domestica]|uniref:Chromosome 11 open reading frame 65 n=1 Tax=Monodelphis domestica TaxID=13616 RepID=F6ZE05_MONDO|nr:protein MFI [Monodelphis domestica]XP_007494940.1 protein MFI [Monodelphis domestica]XP_016289361.1 protein MFI [Monodelphis domestica]